jgi:hypothetical protein
MVSFITFLYDSLGILLGNYVYSSLTKSLIVPPFGKGREVRRDFSIIIQIPSIKPSLIIGRIASSIHQKPFFCREFNPESFSFTIYPFSKIMTL